MVRAVQSLNLALRFMVELAGICALAYWGWSTGAALPIRIALAVGAPLALIVVWALVVAPGADNPLPRDVRMLLGTGLLLVAAGALATAGRPALAGIFAVVVVANQVLLFVLEKEAG